MKRFVLILALACLLAGCAPADYETMADEYLEPEQKAAAEMVAVLPPDATVMTMEGGESIWLCDGFTLSMQTLAAGDLDATLRQVTGYGKDQLAVMTRQSEGLKRHECSWVCAGEGGDQVGRTVILDDGEYHYVLSLLTDAEKVSSLKEDWGRILETVSLDIVPSPGGTAPDIGQ